MKIQAKLILFMMAMSLAVCGCSTLTSAERAARDAKTAQAVEKALAERRYRVEISMMNPMSIIKHGYSYFTHLPPHSN